MKKLTYTIVGTFLEKNRRHIDIYSNLNAEKAKKALAEHLDCFMKNGKVVEPTFAMTSEALKLFVDKSFIKTEFERQKRVYRVWSLCCKFIASGNAGVNSVPCSDHESIAVEAV